METKKVFILGTHSLTSSSDSTLRFGNDNEIVIPYPEGIVELSKIASQYTERGVIAKKLLDYFSTFKTSSLLSPRGTIQKNGSILRFESRFHDYKFDNMNSFSSYDKRRIQIAMSLKEEYNGKKPVIIVSKNPGFRILIKGLGLKAQDFRDDIFPTLEEQYKGRLDCKTSKSKIDMFYEKKFMEIKDIYNYQNINFLPNLFLNISAFDDDNSNVIARYDSRIKKIVPLQFEGINVYGIHAKNAGQLMALEALLQPPEVAPIVILEGEAGTGKTILSLAAALQNTLNEGKIYEKILVTTPTETLRDENLGFLPGEFEQKFDPYLGGVMDNLNIIFSLDKKKSNQSKNNYTKKRNLGSDYDDDKAGTLDSLMVSKREASRALIDRGIIQLQLIGHLRGRSIVDTIFIIDEAQNIEPPVIKSIVTRMGQGSKFVFLGCPTQIDNPELNERYNGLVYLSEKMKDSEICWQIFLNAEESVRSKAAYIASKIL